MITEVNNKDFQRGKNKCLSSFNNNFQCKYKCTLNNKCLCKCKCQ